jgi:hypothetical protein
VSCWFLSFFWRRPGDAAWRPANATTQGEHPLTYMNRAREAYPDNEYRLMFFAEIPEGIFLFTRGATTADEEAAHTAAAP